MRKPGPPPEIPPPLELECLKAGRAFIYAPAISREALRRVAVRQLLESFFSGAEEELLAYLQGRPEAPAAGREHLVDASLDPALL
jgi:predicted transcriptional regulator